MADVKLKVVFENPDAARREMEKLGQSAQQTKTQFDSFSNSAKVTDKELERLLGVVLPLSKHMHEYARNVDVATRALQQGKLSQQAYNETMATLESQMRKAASESGEFKTSFEQITKVVNIARNAFFLLSGAAGIGGAITSLYEAGASMQTLKIAMDASTGSAKEGAAALEFVRKISGNLGLDFQSTASAFQKFSAATEGSAIEGAKAAKVFEQFAGASRVLGLSAADSRLMFIALEQMISKGKVTMEELRGQLGERLPGAFRLSAEAMGVSTAELGKMIANGLDANEFVVKLGETVEKHYGKSIPDAAKTAQAGLERLKNEWYFLKVAVAENMEIMSAAATFFDQLSNRIRNVGDAASNSTPALERFARIASFMIPGFMSKPFEIYSEMSAADRGSGRDYGGGFDPGADFAPPILPTMSGDHGNDVVGQIQGMRESLEDSYKGGEISPEKYSKGLKEVLAMITGASKEEIKLREKVQDEIAALDKKAREQKKKDQTEIAKAAAQVEEYAARDAAEAQHWTSVYWLNEKKKAIEQANREQVDSMADTATWNAYYAEIRTREEIDAGSQVADYWANIRETQKEHDKEVFDALGSATASGVSAFREFATSVRTVMGEVLRGHVNITDQIKKIWSGLWNAILDEFARVMTRAMLEPIMKPFKETFSDLGGWISNNVFSPLWEYIKNGFSELVSWLNSVDWQKTFSSMVSLFASAGSVLGEFFSADFFAATGLDIVVTKPTKIIAGEAGPEHVKITPIGGGGSGQTASGGPGMGDNTAAAGRAVARTALAGLLGVLGAPIGPVQIARIAWTAFQDFKEEQEFNDLLAGWVDGMVEAAQEAAASQSLQDAWGEFGDVRETLADIMSTANEGFGFDPESAPDDAFGGGYDPGGDGGGTSAGDASAGDSDASSDAASGAFAMGTDMIVSKPTRFVAGEVGGSERVTVSPTGAAHGHLRGGGASFQNNGIMIMDEYTLRKFKQMMGIR